MSVCDKYQELISCMLDEELSAEENAALAEHLQSCPECRAMFEAFSGLSAALKEGMEEAPESIRINVMAELRRSDIAAKKKKSKRRRHFLTAAACLVLAVGAGYLAMPKMGRDSVMQYSTTAVYEAAPAEAAPAAEEAVPEYAADTAAEAAEAELKEAPAAEAPAAEAPAAPEPEAASNQALPFETESAAFGTFSLHRGEDVLEDFALPIPEWEDIAALLSGSESETGPEALAVEKSLCINCLINGKEFGLELYFAGGSLYYTDPIDGIFKQSACLYEDIAALIR